MTWAEVSSHRCSLPVLMCWSFSGSRRREGLRAESRCLQFFLTLCTAGGQPWGHPSCNPSLEGQGPSGEFLDQGCLTQRRYISAEKDSRTPSPRLDGEFLLFQGLRGCSLDLKLACVLRRGDLFGEVKSVTLATLSSNTFSQVPVHKVVVLQVFHGLSDF